MVPHSKGRLKPNAQNIRLPRVDIIAFCSSGNDEA